MIEYTQEQIKENRLKVLAALRSGQYKQTTAVLKIDGCFCGGGVICDVSGVGEWVAPYDAGEVYEVYSEDPNETFDIEMPFEVVEWVGENGMFDSFVVQLNDTAELTLPQIADKLAERWSLA